MSQKIITLSSVVAKDFPVGTKIDMPLPDRWEYINQVSAGENLLYIGALPAAKFRAEPDEYYGLSAEINLQLHHLKFYRLFQQKIIENNIDQESAPENKNDIVVSLVLKGEAQAWSGDSMGIIDHCYLYTKNDFDISVTYSFWESVEKDIDVKKIFTQSSAIFGNDDYTKMLSKLGYIKEAKYEGWYSKTFFFSVAA